MELVREQRWTIDDLELFPQPLDDKRYEIIDGELYVSTQPHHEHQFLSAQLIFAIQAWNVAAGAGAVYDAPGVIFAKDEAVAPDIVWVAQDRLGQVLGADGKLHAAPDLVVEIVSPGGANEHRDRVKKLELYSRRGVREYWIVDWHGRRIEVHRRREDALRPTATLLLKGDVLESPMLPGFYLSVADLFNSVPQAEPEL